MALVSETKTHVGKISVVVDNIYSELGFLISRQNADSARIEEIGANVAKLDTKIDILIAQIGNTGAPS
jgi:peptidoglycan hydrolase CwlO-like protein